jgi:Na+/proline symporter
MDNQITEDPYRILARERSHEDVRQTVATNRMLVQSLVFLNGGAAIAALACYGAHNPSGSGKSAALLTIILYCLGVFTAVFAGLYVRRTTQEWSSFWEIKSYPDMAEHESIMEGHREHAIRSKRRSAGLLISSEVMFLVASLCWAISLG